MPRPSKEATKKVEAATETKTSGDYREYDPKTMDAVKTANPLQIKDINGKKVAGFTNSAGKFIELKTDPKTNKPIEIVLDKAHNKYIAVVAKGATLPPASKGAGQEEHKSTQPTHTQTQKGTSTKSADPAPVSKETVSKETVKAALNAEINGRGDLNSNKDLENPGNRIAIIADRLKPNGVDKEDLSRIVNTASSTRSLEQLDKAVDKKRFDKKMEHEFSVESPTPGKKREENFPTGAVVVVEMKVSDLEAIEKSKGLEKGTLLEAFRSANRSGRVAIDALQQIDRSTGSIFRRALSGIENVFTKTGRTVVGVGEGVEDLLKLKQKAGKKEETILVTGIVTNSGVAKQPIEIAVPRLSSDGKGAAVETLSITPNTENIRVVTSQNNVRNPEYKEPKAPKEKKKADSKPEPVEL